MKDYMVKDIRNIAVLGHGSEGKTTLVESMLYAAGVTRMETRSVITIPKRSSVISPSARPWRRLKSTARSSTSLTFPVTSILRAKCLARCTPWRARSSF